MFRTSKSYPTHPLDIPEGSIRRHGYRHHVSVTEEGDYGINGRFQPFGKLSIDWRKTCNLFIFNIRFIVFSLLLLSHYITR